ncbi:MAG: glycosyltransferase family 2 protein [Alphaproteobacteria bacterium]
MQPKFSIIIVNYNAGSYLPRCIAALTEQTVRDFEVFVIDNASTDDSLRPAIATAGDDARFTFVEMDKNLGFAAANNHAAAMANAQWLATLNPDAFPEPDWLAQLLQATRDHPEVAMFGSMQIDAADPQRLDGAGDRYFAAGIPWREQTRERYEAALRNGQKTYPTFAPCAAAALYLRQAFQAAGGFDPAFFCFVEDVDLAFRLRRLGHSCLQVVGARVAHVCGGAGGGRSDFARYYGTRNLIWCFYRNMPATLLFPLAPLQLLALTFLLAQAIMYGRGRTTYHAIADGAKGIVPILRDRRTIANTATTRDIASTMDWWPLSILRRVTPSR